MPLGLFVVECLAGAVALIVPKRLVGSDLADVEPGLRLLVGVVEDHINFLQATEAGFRIEEVNDRDDDEIEDSEDDEGALADSVESHRGDLDNGVVH